MWAMRLFGGNCDRAVGVGQFNIIRDMRGCALGGFGVGKTARATARVARTWCGLLPIISLQNYVILLWLCGGVGGLIAKIPKNLQTFCLLWVLGTWCGVRGGVKCF